MGLYSATDFFSLGYTCAADNATLAVFSYKLNGCRSIFHEETGVYVSLADHL